MHDREPPLSQYKRTGLHVIPKGTVPELLARVANAGIPDDALTPVERAAREWRNEVLADLGGREAVSAARAALVSAAVGSKILLDSIDRYVFSLAAQDRLVNRRSRRAFAIVADRMRIADSLARQLQTLGLERRAKRALDLDGYVAEKYGRPAPSASESGPGATGRGDRETGEGVSAEPPAAHGQEAVSGLGEHVSANEEGRSWSV